MQITATAAEIKALAANATATENLMLWNDGAETWTLENLADELTEEALEGKGEDSEITLTADGLTEAGQDAFTDGFLAAAPLCYNFEGDCQSETPWCAPWTWAGKDEWFSPKFRTPYQMGEAWAHQCSASIKEHFEE